MDENTRLLQYDMDWETFQRVLYYTKKYYGMDAPYFYEAIPFQKEEFVTIFFRTEILLFDRLFDEDKTIAKYIEPIADDEREMLLWVFKFLDCAFLRAEIKEQAEGDNFSDLMDIGEYYHQTMRRELLELYLFCQETPVRSKMTNEIILTINKGVKNFHRKIIIPNYSNWMLRSALSNYCKEHLGNIHSAEDARRELKRYQKAGRTSSNPIADCIIYGTYAMFKDAAKDKKATSTGLCKIITNYLCHLDMITEDEAVDEQLVAGRIKYMLKMDKKPRFTPMSYSEMNEAERAELEKALRRPLHNTRFDDLL